MDSKVYCLDLEESGDAKIHFTRGDDGNILQPIYAYWRGGNQGEDYHQSCTKPKADVTKDEYDFLIQQTNVFYFADIDVHTHEWGKEFNLKGTPSKACKICKTIVPIE